MAQKRRRETDITSTTRGNTFSGNLLAGMARLFAVQTLACHYNHLLVSHCLAMFTCLHAHPFPCLPFYLCVITTLSEHQIIGLARIQLPIFSFHATMFD